MVVVVEVRKRRRNVSCGGLGKRRKELRSSFTADFFFGAERPEAEERKALERRRGLALPDGGGEAPLPPPPLLSASMLLPFAAGCR